MINVAFPNGEYTGDDGCVMTDIKKGDGSFYDYTDYAMYGTVIDRRYGS